MTRLSIPTLALVLCLVAGETHAQSVNTGRLEELRAELSSVSSRVRDKIADTSASMDRLYDTDLDERQQATLDMLEAMETEARVILDQVKLNSPFMDELDRARAEVLVILRKQEREPASPQRDNRVARLEAALSQVEEQYAKLQSVEGQITHSLSEHAKLRRELQLEAGVQSVEMFVQNLSELTANLEQMVAVLDEVSASTLTVSDATPVAQE